MHKSGKKSDKKGGRQREMGRERVYRYLINREKRERTELREKEREKEDRVNRERVQKDREREDRTERERGQSKER